MLLFTTEISRFNFDLVTSATTQYKFHRNGMTFGNIWNWNCGKCEAIQMSTIDMCAMQMLPQNWLQRNIFEETYYKDSLFKTLYDILALHYCQPQVKLKPHIQGQDHFTPLVREPFNEGRLATFQIERGSGKREITWMQAVIKALIFCKHTFAAAALQNCTTHLCTKQKAKHFISN